MIQKKKGLSTWGVILLACAAASLTGTPATRAQSGQKGDEGQILALENAWNQAELQHDPAALQLILTDDFVITEPDGTMQTKRQHMAATKDTSYHYDSLVSEDFRIKVLRNGRGSHGHVSRTRRNQGRPL